MLRHYFKLLEVMMFKKIRRTILKQDSPELLEF